jgi:conjugal transfer mating pair stabilization protein TraG
MSSKIQRKIIRSVKRWFKKRTVPQVILAVLLLGSIVSYTEYMENRRFAVNPASYGQLLTLIASVESKGNYNAYFGNSQNTSVDFTSMPISDVMKWQDNYVRDGSASSAVGKYQIMDTTLRGLVRELKIDTKQHFDPATQDKMAIALIERRGAEAYVNKEMTKEQFASNLSKEWAALPKVIGDNPDESYYSSDGLNKSLVSVSDVLRAIDPISKL